MKIGIKHYDIQKEKLPKSLIVRGALYSILITCLAISILFLIPIQDKLEGSVVLQPLGKIRPISAPVSGIINYHKGTESEVAEGNILATIDWDINTEQIRHLEQLAQYSLTNDKTRELKTLISPFIETTLSGLTGYINSLLNALNQYEHITKQSQPNGVIEKINQEVQQQKLNINQIILRKKQLGESKRLLEKQHLDDLKLYNTGSLSQREYEDRKLNLFNINDRILELNTEQELINSEIERLNTANEELSLKSKKERVNAFAIVLEELNQFQKAYYEASSSKIIRAPIDGQLYIDSEYLDKRFVRTNDIIMSIIPSQTIHQESENYVLLMPRRINEISKGQRVLIALDQYDVNEFGYILSEVRSKSIITDANGFYKIYLKGNSTLASTKGYRLPNTSNYTGTASILLSKKSIAEKISEQILSKKEKLALQ